MCVLSNSWFSGFSKLFTCGPFRRSSFLLSGRSSERPAAVKGASFAAQRTLDGEDRSEIIPRGKECPSEPSRSASMRTRTFPSIFTSLAFWTNSQTQRRGVVGDASTPARSFVVSLWIFVAMLRLCALSCDAENCDLNDTREPNPFTRVCPDQTSASSRSSSSQGAPRVQPQSLPVH